MAPISYPQTWDLASLAPNPAAPEFRQNLDRFKGRLAEFAASTNQLPGVSADPSVVAAWVKLIEDYELLDSQATDWRALIEC
ncbi:MAG TPA: oligoendopeptidase F, partial [Schlesneria sp.]